MLYKKSDFRSAKITDEVFVFFLYHLIDISAPKKFYIMETMDEFLAKMEDENSFIVLSEISFKTRTIKKSLFAKADIAYASIVRINAPPVTNDGEGAKIIQLSDFRSKYE